jgi:hypothetical protein
LFLGGILDHLLLQVLLLQAFCSGGLCTSFPIPPNPSFRFCPSSTIANGSDDKVSLFSFLRMNLWAQGKSNHSLPPGKLHKFSCHHHFTVIL